MKIENIPEYIKKIIFSIEFHGFKAYPVGGCIRDSLLGKEPSDWDIATNALPEDIMSIFPHAIPTGIKHGTVTVIDKNDNFTEITTFRKDGEYKDSRHPENISFTQELETDLARRDFTVNAMACTLDGEIIDPFGGMLDLKNKIIRCVGDPEKRFSEDALRIMRAVRFCSVLNFQLSKETENALFQYQKFLEKISIERIRDEFTKTLLSPCPEKIDFFRHFDVFRIFIPEFCSKSEYEAKSESEILKKLSQNFLERMSFLLYAAVPERVYETMKYMKYDNKTISHVSSVVNCLTRPIPHSGYDIRKMLSDKHTAPGLDTALHVQKAIFSNDLKTLALLDKAEKQLNITLKENVCVSLAQLALTGKDLDLLGIKNGKEKGTVLKQLLEAVLVNPRLNNRSSLSEIVLKIRSSS